MDLKLYTVEEVAEMFGISPRTARKWKYRIGYFRFGRRILFRQADIEKFIKTYHVAPPQNKLRSMRGKLISLFKRRAGV